MLKNLGLGVYGWQHINMPSMLPTDLFLPFAAYCSVADLFTMLQLSPLNRSLSVTPCVRSSLLVAVYVKLCSNPVCHFSICDCVCVCLHILYVSVCMCVCACVRHTV